MVNQMAAATGTNSNTTKRTVSGATLIALDNVRNIKSFKSRNRDVRFNSGKDGVPLRHKNRNIPRTRTGRLDRHGSASNQNFRSSEELEDVHQRSESDAIEIIEDLINRQKRLFKFYEIFLVVIGTFINGFGPLVTRILLDIPLK